MSKGSDKGLKEVKTVEEELTFASLREYHHSLYELNPKSVGRAYIFANAEFNEKKLERRDGNEKDEGALKTLLEKMGFKTKLLSDLTRSGFDEEMNKISKVDFSNDSCVLVAVLSHVDEDKVWMKDRQVDEDEFYDRFSREKCPAMIGKPKIFLFQTCKGFKSDKTTNLSDQTDTTYFTEAVTTDDDVIELEGESSSTTPSTADVIKCLATSHGFVSFRNTHHGSWFIQNFVDVFNTYVEDKSDDEIDFLSLMMVVAKKVASKSATDKCGNIYKQMPCVTTTLQKRIVFPKAKDICHVQSPVGDVKAESNDKSNPTVSK